MYKEPKQNHPEQEENKTAEESSKRDQRDDDNSKMLLLLDDFNAADGSHVSNYEYLKERIRGV